MKVLVTGASGKLGRYLVRSGLKQPVELFATSRRPLDHPTLSTLTCDLCDPQAARELLEQIKPQVVLHSAALSVVNDCLADPQRADLLNRQLPERLSNWCLANQAYFVHLSTDMVFDGEMAPYAESDPPSPSSHYGKSKWEGEKAVLVNPQALVVRLPLMVGPALGPDRSFYDHLVQQLSEAKAITLFEDEWRTILSYEQAAETLWELLPLRPTGILHLAGHRLSRLEFGELLAQQIGGREHIRRGLRSDFSGPEPRPRDLSLRIDRLQALLPHWRPQSPQDWWRAWSSHLKNLPTIGASK